jgi:hypothetical protein
MQPYGRKQDKSFSWFDMRVEFSGDQFVEILFNILAVGIVVYGIGPGWGGVIIFVCNDVYYFI